MPEGEEGCGMQAKPIKACSIACLAQVDVRERAKREREVVKARGPPPPPTRWFRAPQACIGDLLSTWELLCLLTPLVGLAPLPFWRFEAALCPISVSPNSTPSASTESGDGGCKGGTQPRVERVLRTRKAKAADAEGSTPKGTNDGPPACGEQQVCMLYVLDCGMCVLPKSDNP